MKVRVHHHPVSGHLSIIPVDNNFVFNPSKNGYYEPLKPVIQYNLQECLHMVNIHKIALFILCIAELEMCKTFGHKRQLQTTKGYTYEIPNWQEEMRFFQAMKNNVFEITELEYNALLNNSVVHFLRRIEISKPICHEQSN